MTKKLLIFLLPIYLILTGCDNKEDILKTDNKAIEQKEKTQTTKKMQNPSNALGVSQKDGVITIDTNKTKSFLEGIVKKLENGVKDAQSTIKNNRVDSAEDAGITITKDKISIDINKTEKFLNRWRSTMEDAVNQMDEAIQEVEKSLPKN